MSRNRLFTTGVLCSVALSTMAAWGRDKPAPSASRYTYTFKIDPKSLPEGVTVREVVTGPMSRYFIKNAGPKPLIISEIFSNDKLVSGTKLENGKVYGWFPSGVPMEGKTHLKGWQMPFGEINETILTLSTEPAMIAEGRKPGLDKNIPKAEDGAIKVNYDGKPTEIKITIHYGLNDEYDKIK